jgi:co-chaperonin GroES (HSP10)
MRLLNKRVLLELIEEQPPKSGLILPNSEKKNIGKVILTGEKVKAVSVGDTVKFYQYAGMEMIYQNKNCLLLSEEVEIIAIL